MVPSQRCNFPAAQRMNMTLVTHIFSRSTMARSNGIVRALLWSNLEVRNQQQAGSSTKIPHEHTGGGIQKILSHRQYST